MSTANKQSKSFPPLPENDVTSKGLPGYPLCLETDDIFRTSPAAEIGAAPVDARARHDYANISAVMPWRILVPQERYGSRRVTATSIQTRSRKHCKRIQACETEFGRGRLGSLQLYAMVCERADRRRNACDGLIGKEAANCRRAKGQQRCFGLISRIKELLTSGGLNHEHAGFAVPGKTHCGQ